MGIAWGLIAALSWGISDVLVTQIARRIGVGHLLVSFEGAGLVAAVALLLLRAESPVAAPGAWALMLGLGVLNGVGAFLLYRAFRIGTLSVVAPVASANAIVTGVLAFAAGERPGLFPGIGVFLLVMGVAVVTRAHYAGGVGTLAGLPEALGVVFCFGVFYWALNLVTPVLGVFWPILVLRTVRVIGGLLIQMREAPAPLTGALWGRVIVAAALSTVAFAAFNLGLNTTHTAIVASLASLSSAVTVLFARVLLREQLAPGQWVGVGLILLGALLVSQG